MASGRLDQVSKIRSYIIQMYAFDDVNAEKRLMRFAIFTHVMHKRLQKNILAYSPYVREMNLWFKYVDEVEVIAPQPLKGEPFIGEAYKCPIKFSGISSFNLLSITEIIKSIFKIPIIFFRILIAMRRADHLHLRCPGNIGFIACFAQMFYPDKPKTAKYAGNWDPQAKQPWSYKLQKWILSKTFLTRNMKILVYGEWPGQTKNVVPFFTASFSEKEREIINKDISIPYKFLFVGNLVRGKQPGDAIKIVEKLNKRNIPAELHVYGDGELIASLQDQTKNKNYIHLHGNQPLEVLKHAYKESHFLILASKSEGWPKAVAEAMFFGCIPIATKVSCVPWMLGDGSRGILISEDDLDRNRVESGERKVDSHDDEEKLLDTFQKNCQFECFPNNAEAVSENVSRTGLSETPGNRQGRLEVTSGIKNEWKDALDETVKKIIELINDHEEMKRMSMEAQEWSQEYTLEKFEAEIKKLLSPQPPKGEQISKL